MNRKKKPFLILCLVLAVLLGIPIFGWAMVLHVFGKCEQIIMEHESHEALLAALKPEAVLLLVCSGLIVMGVLICIILIFWISANELQLSQLLLNLILNGFHAMQDSGGLMTVDTWFDEDSVFLSVSDTGCGIPENILPHIFDPFFTTKEEGKGTGLGLAIAAQVVEEHRGSIHVDSQVGKGSEFTVSLPRRTEAECGSIENLNKY